ncbi:unnamed protein product, partial [Sphacelaria rigidula]
MLVVDPERRMTADGAFSHPWFQAADQSLAERDLGENLQQFQVFNATRKLRAA